MKHLLSLLLMFTLISHTRAQELTDSHINKVDTQGKRQGIWRVYDGDGNLKFTGEFIDNKPTGEFKYLYPNGKVKAILHYSDSGRVAYSTNYYLNGNIMTLGKYIDQKKDSAWLYYTEEDGKLASEEHYLAGLKEGTWKVYYPEGNVAEEITYHSGLRDGPWIQYFTDGSVKQSASYVADQLEGLFVIHHLNGNVEVSGTYFHDNKNGTWVYLSQLGELEKREEYINGNLVKQELFDIKK